MKEIEYELMLERHADVTIRIDFIQARLLNYAQSNAGAEAEEIYDVIKEIEVIKELVEYLVHDAHLMIVK